MCCRSTSIFWKNMGIDSITSTTTTVAWHRLDGSAIIPVEYCTKIDRAVDASSISSECRQLVVLVW